MGEALNSTGTGSPRLFMRTVSKWLIAWPLRIVSVISLSSPARERNFGKSDQRLAGNLYESRPAQQTAIHFGREDFQRLVLSVTPFFWMPGDDTGSVLDPAHPAPNN